MGTGTPLIPEHQERERRQLAEAAAARIEQDRRDLRGALDPQTRDQQKVDKIWYLNWLTWDEFMAVAEMTGEDSGEPSLLSVRRAALVGLNQQSLEKSEPAIPRLVTLLESAEPELEQTIIEGMKRFGPKAAEAVPALIKILERTDPDIEQVRLQKEAAQLLAAIGQAAAPALPALERRAYAVQDVPLEMPGRNFDSLSPEESHGLYTRAAQMDACMAAYQTFEQLSQVTPLSAVEFRQQGVKGLSGREGLRAFAAIDQSVLPREEALQLLETFLISNPPLVEQVRAMQSLKRLEPESPVSAEILLTKMRAEDELVWRAAQAALLQFRPGSFESVMELSIGLQHPLDRVFIASCRALTRFGAQAKSIQQNLLFHTKQINSRTHHERVGHLFLLVQAIGPEASPFRSWLFEWLPDDSPYLKDRHEHYREELQALAMYTLGEIGTPPEALPLIREYLATPKKSVKFAAAAHAARNLKGQQAQLVPLLLPVLTAKFYDRPLNFHRLPISTGYPVGFDPEVETTAILEALQTLENIGSPQAATILLELKTFVQLREERARKQNSSLPADADLGELDICIKVAREAIQTLSQ